MCRLGESRIGRRLVAEMPVEDCVVGGKVVDLRLARFRRARQIDDRLKNAVVDFDPFRCVARFRIRLRYDNGDRVAHKARLAVRESRERADFHW